MKKLEGSTWPQAHVRALVSSLLIITNIAGIMLQVSLAASQETLLGGDKHRKVVESLLPERIKVLRDKLRPLKVGALVFYGRRDKVKILNTYLERNLFSAGGILHEVLFLRHTENKEDLQYLEELLACHPAVYHSKFVSLKREAFAQILHSLPRDRLYVKMDDDILYIEDGTIELLAEAKLHRQDLYLVSANVVNHPILGPVHCHLQAMIPFAPIEGLSYWCEPPLSHQQCEAQGKKMGPCRGNECNWVIVTNSNGTHQPLDIESASVFAIYNESEAENKNSCFWGDWKCAAIAHNSFLHRWKEGTLDAFKFSVWDFSFPDYNRRWSTNFILFNTSILPTTATEFYYSEEVMLGLGEPAKKHMHCAAIGETLVAHFGYWPQNYYLHRYTNLLQRYEEVAQQLMADHHQTPYNSSQECSNLYSFA